MFGVHLALQTERDGQLQVIQSLSEGYEDLSSQNARLLSQIEDVSARVTSVMQESLRYSGQVDSLTKEKADVEQQLHACQDLVAVLRKEIRDGKAALDQMRREVRCTLCGASASRAPSPARWLLLQPCSTAPLGHPTPRSPVCPARGVTDCDSAPRPRNGRVEEAGGRSPGQRSRTPCAA